MTCRMHGVDWEQREAEPWDGLPGSRSLVVLGKS